MLTIILQTKEDEDMDGEIAFSAKYGSWISIKKMSIDDKTSPAEVAFALSGITNTIDRKGFVFLGIDIDLVDAYVEKIVGSRRRSYGAVAEIFSNLKQADIKGELLKAIKPTVAPLPPDKTGNPVSWEEKLPLAESYFMRSLMTRLGFDFNVNGDALAKLYPDLKFPKPKGNFGKKKG
ncbi:MAG: DUF2666 family protein [Candidatus Micrarchaeota archaeon]